MSHQQMTFIYAVCQEPHLQEINKMYHRKLSLELNFHTKYTESRHNVYYAKKKNQAM